ncbi:flagellar hook-basal body complex protein [Poseidonibacter lekithochrous]|uniref:flagellar hook-basal body complex protein n=1 Tax=Poseidonibacter TaxID=2321187 RepID=UPI001C083F9C|nr:MULTISPECIES: flagellar hook-basal body complex protein [Poseidonibacter]MBU3015506.1 flagellar hook-basal body complex protein [Poseidonibacter lekithochrous]MDO6828805.1 flagellar hook-basal body complex protein [Poseidonibacter sp. 1_MG-2023]
MIGALWTGISGLSSQQTALDNESNNIANVNTVGYKASRISFADQMYQDGIGKGSKIVDAEKLYTQGNLKLTGVSYDMALSGDGFFTVTDASASGTTENYYTRAGNFRMGENGTLQDANGNEVQGWAMSAIDTDNDVTSTNSNISMFTNDYTKLLTSKIVSHSNYVETFTAKATDYAASAESDSESVFSGAGLKTKSAKISDVEAAISNYTSWLQKLQDTPDGASISSVAQRSEINFESGSDSIISKEGDEIYVYIDGNKISQSYIPTTADTELIAELEAIETADPGSTGLTVPYDAADEAIVAEYNQAASKIATYKGLADTISEISGLVAYMSSEVGGTTSDTLEEDDTFGLSTSTADMMKGIIQIKSLIPGEEFIISEVGEVSGSSTIQGDFQTSVNSLTGSGTGAVESARDALSQLISGKQQDVYTTSALNFDATTPATSFEFAISIYDEDAGESIPVPNDNGTPLLSAPITITATTVDEFVTDFNTQAATATPVLTDYVEAVNVNGNLVIRTKDSNYDAEFSTTLTDATNTETLTKNNDLSGKSGAGAEFIEMVTKVDQTSSQNSLQLRLDTLGISDSAFGEFSVDSNGLITMTQDGAEIAVGQASIALFTNNIGLEAIGDNLLAKTTQSGDPIYNLNNDKAATIESQTLELSTADLSESLVNLMVFQRAFEANAKSITTADEILTTLIGLKR